jgi:hypothetical protein
MAIDPSILLNLPTSDARGYPGILYEYQNKGITEFAIRKLLILKGAILVVLGLQRG